MQPKHLGVDGFPRSKDQDKIISQNVQSLFKTPNGQEVLKYLKNGAQLNKSVMKILRPYMSIL